MAASVLPARSQYELSPTPSPPDEVGLDLRGPLASSVSSVTAVEGPLDDEGESDATDVVRHSLASYTIAPSSPHYDFPLQPPPTVEQSVSPRTGLIVPPKPTHHSRASSSPPVPHDVYPIVAEAGPKSGPLDQDLRSKQSWAGGKLKSGYRALSDDGEPNSSASEREGSVRTTKRVRHSRKASFVPGIDIGSAPMSAAPPAERPISVSIRPVSLYDHPAMQGGYFDPSPASVALARTSSLSSQSSSAFGIPGPSRTPAMPIPAAHAGGPVDPAFYPQSPVPPPPQSPGASTAEDYEPDQHPLYTLLSKSMTPRLRSAWQAARLVLVPPRESLPPAFYEWGHLEDETEEESAAWQNWVASHAFKPTEEQAKEGQEKFEAAADGIMLEAIVDAVANQVHLSRHVDFAAQQRAASGPHASSPPTAGPSRLAASMPASPPSHSPSPLSTARPSRALTRSLPIQSEMTVYRQRATRSSTAPTVRPSATPTGKKEKRGIKGPAKWFRAVSKSKMTASSPPDTALPEPPEEPLLERIKLLSVGAEVVAWGRGSGDMDVDEAKEVMPDEDRCLLSDIAFFQEPPEHLADHVEALQDALMDLVRLVQEFATSFLHVAGYETYTLKRIRSKIMDPVWHRHLAPLNRLDGTLFERLENVVMGLCHEQLYTRVILPQHEPRNRYLDTVLAIYRDRCLSAEDFSLSLPASVDFGMAFGILRSLNGSDALTPSNVDIDQLTNMLGDVDEVASLLHARTPLDLLTRLHRALEALGEAVKMASSSSSAGLTVDDYIPLLSWALIQADVKDLESLTYYMQSFVQSDLTPGMSWSQTTFDAAVAFLRTDPFFAEVSRPGSNAATPSAEVPPLRPEARLRRVSTMSMATGPVLSVHHTSSPPKRSPSTISLPSTGAEAVSPTTAPGDAFETSMMDDALLSPAQGPASSLFSRRLQSGRKLPDGISGGIDVRGRRRLSASESAVRTRSRASTNEMPPPVFPASAGMARGRSQQAMDARLAEELAAQLDDMLPGGNPVILQPPTPDGELRQQLGLRSPQLARQPSRSYHVSTDFEAGASSAPLFRSSRAPLGRTQSQQTSSSQDSSQDMRRSQSDGQKRSSMDMWLFGRSPVSERSTSPRSSSPSSVRPSLERTLSIGSEITDGDAMWAWNRNRLSSASSSSLVSSEGLSRQSSQTDHATRTRKNSVSAADILNRLHSSTSAVDTSQPRSSYATRRQSTLSISSVDSSASSSTSAAPRSPPTLILAASHRRRQSSSRLRRDLLMGPSPLAPRQDSTNVISLPAAYGHTRLSSFAESLPSPIKEHTFTPSSSRDASPSAPRISTFDRPLSASPESSLSPPTSPLSAASPTSPLCI